jgi:hypothetical protein
VTFRVCVGFHLKRGERCPVSARVYCADGKWRCLKDAKAYETWVDTQYEQDEREGMAKY